MRSRVFFVIVLSLFCIALFAPTNARLATAPVLLTKTNSTRALAVESTSLLAEPFWATTAVPFSQDNRTRVMLFATNLALLPGETVTATAEDGNHVQYPLTVEYTGGVPNLSGVTSVILRLHDNLGDVGDVLVGITVHGMTSNRVRIGIGHVGGGPPDDMPAPQPTPDLGSGASLHGKQIFPFDNAWNQDISNSPVDPNSDNIIAGMGLTTSLHPDFGTVWDGAPNGIPYVVVAGNQTPVAINFTAFGAQSDNGPYPVPADAPVEGGPNGTGDRHVLVVDRDNWKLYEMYRAFPVSNGWNCDSGAIFDLNSNALRPAGWTSADAAGLPIFPGLVRYDEVFEQQEIRHAIRFTAQITRRAYIAPARHWASTNTSVDRPPMGMRVRLKASVNISGYSPAMQVILRAMKKYGLILADNGSNWFISGAPDPRWSDDDLNTLKQIKGANFEVIKMENIVTQ